VGASWACRGDLAGTEKCPGAGHLGAFGLKYVCLFVLWIGGELELFGQFRGARTESGGPWR
jgi:hypothetical protein